MFVACCRLLLVDRFRVLLVGVWWRFVVLFSLYMLVVCVFLLFVSCLSFDVCCFFCALSVVSCSLFAYFEFVVCCGLFIVSRC